MDNVCFQEMPLRVIMVGAMPALTKHPGFEEFYQAPKILWPALSAPNLGRKTLEKSSC